MKNSVQYLVVVLLMTFSDQVQSQNLNGVQPKLVLDTKDLVVTKISQNAFTHVSYLQTNDFGNVPCNGLIVRSANEVIIYDTPTNDSTALNLIKWVNDILHCKIIAIIPTHFHNDCLGGLKAFHDNKIPSYANNATIQLAKSNNVVVPQNGFNGNLELKIGNTTAVAKFVGEGHTKDNVVGYFPSENILFGGCLIKELDATKGYLGDANTAAWSNTVQLVKKEFPKVQIVVPGHGNFGNSQLLDYTIQLFKENRN